MPESLRRQPKHSELVAWTIFRHFDERAPEDATELHDLMASVEDRAPSALHAELWKECEEFREEFLAPCEE